MLDLPKHISRLLNDTVDVGLVVVVVRVDETMPNGLVGVVELVLAIVVAEELV